ncbi:MAG: DUF4435 domain-containing protein [Phycisphaerales bacterium]
MLHWPARAKAAIQALFQPLQDIDIFVEDENDEVFYCALLKRLAGSKIRIARVFGLGGRTAVVAAATTGPVPGRRALYVIDGDLEWVRGEPAPAAPTLFRHEAYCIDNFLICEQAVALVVAQDTVLSEDAAKANISLTEWIAEISDPLVELFAAYATANRLNPSARTVSAGVGVLCTASGKQKPQTLATAKVRKATEAVLQSTSGVAGTEATQCLFEATLARAKSLPHPIDAVSGKDFLLPLLNAHIQRHGCRVSRRALRMRLAGACQVERLAPLGSAMTAVAARGLL